MKATRHNGRSGKHGSYNPKHNDRNFDLKHSEHIDANMVMQNVYWDCYTRKRTATSKGNYENFDAIELRFYEENYGDFVENQNERNAENRHTERNRTVKDIYQNKKTCPEESIYQLGTMDASVKPETLVKVTEDFLTWFEESYGQFVHSLDWALHVDEATPHIHERHVFDAPNNYGEIAPQQDKALELLGFDLPYPNKPKSKSNNRKMVFDATCRNKFLEICEKYGLSVDEVVEYGGREYLEKNDFIIQNQRIKLGRVNEEIETKEQKIDSLNTELMAINTVIDCIADTAYSESCNLVIGEMAKRMVSIQVDDVKESATSELEESRTNFYTSMEKNAVRKVVKIITDKFDVMKDRFTRLFEDFFLGSDRRRKNVELVTDKIWSRVENLAIKGIEEEDLVWDKSMPIETKEEVAEQVQVVAEQIARKGRGRHR